MAATGPSHRQSIKTTEEYIKKHYPELTGLQLTPEFILNLYPAGDLWRFWIDGHRQSEGRMAFDIGRGKEEGYTKSMQKTWFTLFDPSFKERYPELTPGLFSHVHYLAVKSTDIPLSEHEKKAIRNCETNFGLCENQNITEAGLVEFLQQVKTEDLTKFFKLKYLPADALSSMGGRDIIFSAAEQTSGNQVVIELDKVSAKNAARAILEIADHNGLKIVQKKVDPQLLIEEITRIINNYQSDIKDCETENQKLECIVNCLQRLERLHPFMDGNCRTNNILLQFLLRQNNMLPTILHNPNALDMFSSKELIEEIRKGQKRVVELSIARPLLVLQSNSLQSVYKKFVESDIENPYFSIYYPEKFGIPEPLVKKTVGEFKKLIVGALDDDIPAAMNQLQMLYRLFRNKSVKKRAPVVTEHDVVCQMLHNLYYTEYKLKIEGKFVKTRRKLSSLKNKENQLQTQYKLQKDWKDRQPIADKITQNVEKQKQKSKKLPWLSEITTGRCSNITADTKYSIRDCESSSKHRKKLRV